MLEREIVPTARKENSKETIPKCQEKFATLPIKNVLTYQTPHGGEDGTRAYSLQNIRLKKRVNDDPLCKAGGGLSWIGFQNVQH
jgi:hypothetical protein